MWSILVNNVPVLSKTTLLTLVIYSKMVFFLIRMPDFKAKFKVITTTDGTANPSAHGHDATKIEIDLSKGKHQTQY